MSVVTIDTLVSVHKRMMYTHYGEGSDYERNRRNGTDRVAAEMGDAQSAFDFVHECEQAHLEHPSAKYEGYELMFSWSKDEMDPSKQSDIERCMLYAYNAAHEIQPSCKVWVTMHVDGSESAVVGELGPIHAHVTTMNHDFVTGKCIQHGMTVPRIRAINDHLSRDYGFQTLAKPLESEWSKVRENVEDKFSLALGDKVLECRDGAETLEDFKDNLDAAGIELRERMQKDRSTGVEHVGWTYRMFDELSPNRKSGRRRRANSLADDLTKEGIERYFEAAPERRAELLAQQEAEAREAAQRQAIAEKQQEEAQAEEIQMSLSERLAAKLSDLSAHWQLEDEFMKQGMSQAEAEAAADEQLRKQAEEAEAAEAEEFEDAFDYTSDDEYADEDYSYEDEDYSDEDMVEDEEDEGADEAPELRITFKHEPMRWPDPSKPLTPEAVQKMQEEQRARAAQQAREEAEAKRQQELQRRKKGVQAIPGAGGSRQHQRTYGLGED